MFTPTLTPAAMRPREKIQQYGVQTLSTSELLSVILGSGSQHVSVTQLAERIAEKLVSTKAFSLADLQHIKGVGLAKACQILASIELVERLRPGGLPVMDSLTKVLQQVGELRYANKEHIVCLYLNARLQLLLKETLAVGSVNQSILQPRDVFSVIRHHPISHIILVHNHPSGMATPSKEDLAFTELIINGGKIMGVEVIDHVIIAKEAHYSWKEHGLLQ